MNIKIISSLFIYFLELNSVFLYNFYLKKTNYEIKQMIAFYYPYTIKMSTSKTFINLFLCPKLFFVLLNEILNGLLGSIWTLSVIRGIGVIIDPGLGPLAYTLIELRC